MSRLRVRRVASIQTVRDASADDAGGLRGAALMRSTRRNLLIAGAVAVVLTIALALPAAARNGDDRRDNDHGARARHVLLISVDGLHQSDLAWYVQTHPNSTLAGLVNRGID